MLIKVELAVVSCYYSRQKISPLILTKQKNIYTFLLLVKSCYNFILINDCVHYGGTKRQRKIQINT